MTVVERSRRVLRAINKDSMEIPVQTGRENRILFCPVDEMGIAFGTEPVAKIAQRLHGAWGGKLLAGERQHAPPIFALLRHGGVSWSVAFHPADVNAR